MPHSSFHATGITTSLGERDTLSFIRVVGKSPRENGGMEEKSTIADEKLTKGVQKVWKTPTENLLTPAY